MPNYNSTTNGLDNSPQELIIRYVFLGFIFFILTMVCCVKIYDRLKIISVNSH